jgi:hypothetical protein
MNERSALELRVAALVRAYADRAPTDVDPMAMALRAAGGSGHTTPAWFGVMPPGRGLVFVLVLIALLVSILSGALISGALPIRRDPVDILVERAFVEPFVGLPPEGAPPSMPATGELVLSFGGRVRSLGLDFHRMWLYTDGRLIWKSNLEGATGARKLRFGESEPTTGVIVQHLTPEGVELLRYAAIAAGLQDRQPLGPGEDPTDWGRPGVLWGGLVMRDGGRLVQAEWSDPALPGLLAVPASWLPASAWADQRISAYVPYRYAVCADDATDTPLTERERSRVIDLLPGSTKDLIRSLAIDPAPGWNDRDPRCAYLVSTEDARVIAATLDAPPLRREPGTPLRYRIPVGPLPRDQQPMIELLPVLPDGEAVCNCG